MHSKFDDCKRGPGCIEIPQNLHGLHVGVLKHGSGHVHQGRVVEETGQVHPTRTLQINYLEATCGNAEYEKF